MNRIDRIYQQVKAHTGRTNKFFSLGMITCNDDGTFTAWGNLWNGAPGSWSSEDRITVQCSTMEEAQVFLDELKQQHPYTGRNAWKYDPVVILLEADGGVCI